MIFRKKINLVGQFAPFHFYGLCRGGKTGLGFQTVARQLYGG